MLSASFVVMYSVMFFNVAEIGHIYLSLTRLYMTLLMVCPMALIMLFSMKGMYNDRKKNTILVIVIITLFVLSFIFLRTQTPIGDEQYMKAMISHHSSAILTSEEANIQDPEVRQLADDIIEIQKREIAQMENLLDKLENSK